MSPEPIRTLSLFSGAGGLDIGFHDAGFEIVDVVELEARFVETLKANHTEAGYFGHAQAPKPTNIKDYVPDASLNIDFVIGGPPCQAYSLVGRSRDLL